ncbi:MAG: PilZ domain-containing protein [Candidatus Omnitrophica bacterium]|nr:PilZ domain-containing protein [Candidatus Omnitrophota bacterium]
MIQEKKGIERRQYIRAKRVLSVEFKLIKSSRKNVDHSTHISTTEDMSLGGISFYSPFKYMTDDVLNIRVVMSGVLEIFTGPAKVVRSIEKKSGTVFLVAVKFLKTATKKRSAKSFSPSSVTAVTTKRKSAKRII